MCTDNMIHYDCPHRGPLFARTPCDYRIASDELRYLHGLSPSDPQVRRNLLFCLESRRKRYTHLLQPCPECVKSNRREMRLRRLRRLVRRDMIDELVEEEGGLADEGEREGRGEEMRVQQEMDGEVRMDQEREVEAEADIQREQVRESHVLGEHEQEAGLRWGYGNGYLPDEEEEQRRLAELGDWPRIVQERIRQQHEQREERPRAAANESEQEPQEDEEAHRRVGQLYSRWNRPYAPVEPEGELEDYSDDEVVYGPEREQMQEQVQEQQRESSAYGGVEQPRQPESVLGQSRSVHSPAQLHHREPEPEQLQSIHSPAQLHRQEREREQSQPGHSPAQHHRSQAPVVPEAHPNEGPMEVYFRQEMERYRDKLMLTAFRLPHGMSIEVYFTQQMEEFRAKLMNTSFILPRA